MKYNGRDDDGFTTLFQKHPFRFMVRTAAYGKTFRVDFSLFNEAWDKADNMRDGLDCRPLDHFPSRTFPYVCIRKKGDNGMWEGFFFEAECYVFQGDIEFWAVSLGSCEVWRGLTAAQRATLRFSMRSVLLCAKRIAAYPDRTDYPSAEYLMRQFPGCWLHDYFPEELKKRDLRSGNQD